MIITLYAELNLACILYKFWTFYYPNTKEYRLKIKSILMEVL